MCICRYDAETGLESKGSFRARHISRSTLFGKRPQAPAWAIFFVSSEAWPLDSRTMAAAADCRCFAEVASFGFRVYKDDTVEGL